MTRTAVPGGPRRTHTDALRTFDHENLAELPGYPALRQALHAIASQADEATLTTLVDAAQDCAATALLGDWCALCQRPAWPHRGIRSGNVITAIYWCGACQSTWSRAYAITGSLVIRARRQRPGPDDRPTTTTTARDQE